MKILIVNNHLETGGICQSLISLVQNLDKTKYCVDLQLLKSDNDIINKYQRTLKDVNVCKPYLLLNIFFTSFKILLKRKNVLVILLKITLEIVRKLIGNKRVINALVRLSKCNKSYDLAISYSNDIWGDHVNGFYGGCNDYVIEKVNAKKKIAWIHNEPQRLGLTYEICKKTYKNFDVIVNVSYACKKMFDTIIPEYENKSKVVYNFFDIEKISYLSNSFKPYKNNLFHIVTVARLDNQQKRLDRVISCCEILKENGFNNFQWHIVGDGPDQNMLISLSNKKNTSDVLVFEGRKDNPYPYIKNADIFVQTSDYEAYSMVLAESIILNTPVICTRYPSSCEIIYDGENGILCDVNNNCITDVLKSLIINQTKIEYMRNYMEFHKYSNDLAIQQLNEVIGD